MPNDRSENPKLTITGRKIDKPALPRLLQARTRSVTSPADDPFLPPGYVKPVAAFDVSAAARSTDEGNVENSQPTRSNEVIALELTDGTTIFTSPSRLRETLEQIAPDSCGTDGSIQLDALRDYRGVARGSIGEVASNLFLRVTSLDVGSVSDAIIELARKKALEWLREKAEDKVVELAELGVSWLGTKALMWAIENGLARKPGLYRWTDAIGKDGESRPLQSSDIEVEASQGSLLIFIHGTGSNTAGSFADLMTVSRDYWSSLETRFGDRIFALEHRTLSESPIENALQLARALPARSRINLVSHSRGGLVADLMCLANLDGTDQSLVVNYGVDDKLIPAADGKERDRLLREIERAHGENRAHLRELATVLRDKQLVVERYVRVASPARGTRLASSNLDVFLSGLLSLIKLVPALAVSPLYSAFTRVVLEIAKNRTNPRLVPGIEAMLPESPMARFLAQATPQDAIKMAVIAGDIEGGGLLKRLGVMFTDHAFFDGKDNDLVVDTDSMYAGIARPSITRAIFDQGREVSHFNYFKNEKTRNALQRWLLARNAFGVEVFDALPGLDRARVARDAVDSSARSVASANLPIVVLLPGVMGSHLWRDRRDRVWFDFDDLLTGGFEKLKFTESNVEAECLFETYYGKLATHLSATHRVERFAYDWRQPLNGLAGALAKRLRELLDDPANEQLPIRLLAHSMGGLLVRALIHDHREVWDRLISRRGARFIMLGTPNQGAHSMVETLIGKSSAIRGLARIDLKHDLQTLLTIVAGFPGALALLPRPGFKEEGGQQFDDYFTEGFWKARRSELQDLWFGNQICATPSQGTLDAARWLWDRDSANGRPSIPTSAATGGIPEKKIFYVHGCADSTPVGLEKVGGRWKMQGTSRGDGTVTWASGSIDGIEAKFWMPARHGALASTAEYFDALATLLAAGTPGTLLTAPPATRDGAVAGTWNYEAGPPIYPSALDLASGLMGGAEPQLESDAATRPRLSVHVRATDLRFLTKPILVGHYEQDAISGAEALIDRELVKGALRVRYDLGMYAGPLGTATVVLPFRNELERQRGSSRGAVVAGLGKYDGSLSVTTLTEAVRTAAVRYLLHIADLSEGSAGDAGKQVVSLASLLIGYNSSANLSVNDAVLALVRGVAEANHRFAETTKLPLCITELEIVEVHLDTAITATYALRRAAEMLNSDPQLQCQIVANPLLQRSDGARPRLADVQTNGYWERVVISNADPGDSHCPLEPKVLQRLGDLVNTVARGPAGTATGAQSEILPTATDARNSGCLHSRVASAERLRFLYLGQRARAESIVQHRQAGLVEALVEQQLNVRMYQEDFSRTLFQLLLPHEFKDAARQLARVVLVLDGYTANLPWELMLADEKPLAVKVALVRQLSSTRFRARARQSAARRAYVVGNPASSGFAQCFVGSRGQAMQDPPALPAAENEAMTVNEVLAQYGYEVIRSIGSDQRTIDVINRLYQHPYRVLHIAAHGVFDQRHVDGTTRTGVVLSDGMLMTAAEIGAMEIVPDLVFLNCCHLGKVDAIPTAYNRLSYSIARELIEMGVRAVVVAGWAVDDDAASLFADAFYRFMLGDKMTFGDAVFEARKAVWERFPSGMTWGAYQAYGDPGFRLEPGGDDYDESASPIVWQPVAPIELVARLEQEKLRLKRLDDVPNPVECRRVTDRIEAIRANVPTDWWSEADIALALGQVYAAMGPDYFLPAIEQLRAAIRGTDRPASASLVALEELANLEARYGEVANDVDVVQMAIDRLLLLTRLAAGVPKGQESDPALVGAERAGILGSAYKRLGAVLARKYLAEPETSAQKALLRDQWLSALKESRQWYAGPIAGADPRQHDPYVGLNVLFLAALQPQDENIPDLVARARTYAEICNVRYSSQPNFWNAVMAADAYLAETLLNDTDWQTAQIDDVVTLLKTKYEQAMAGVAVQPKDLDSTVKQIGLFACFFAALGEGTASRSSVIAKVLEQLAQRLSSRFIAQGITDDPTDSS